MSSRISRRFGHALANEIKRAETRSEKAAKRKERWAQLPTEERTVARALWLARQQIGAAWEQGHPLVQVLPVRDPSALSWAEEKVLLYCQEACVLMACLPNPRGVTADIVQQTDTAQHYIVLLFESREAKAVGTIESAASPSPLPQIVNPRKLRDAANQLRGTRQHSTLKSTLEIILDSRPDEQAEAVQKILPGLRSAVEMRPNATLSGIVRDLQAALGINPDADTSIVAPA